MMADFLEQLRRSQKAKEARGEVGPYVKLRESVPDQELWADWRDGDRWRGAITEEYAKIRADETLSEAGRAQKEQEVYERSVNRAAKGWDAARVRAERLAKENEQKSIPMPNGHTLFSSIVKDPTTVLAVQTESERISKEVSGKSLQQITKEVSKNPNDKGMQDAAGKVGDTLRHEFNAAMETGGIEGEIRARGALRVAEAMGVEHLDVTSDYRGQRHLEAQENARQYELFSGNIPSVHNIPTPAAPPREGRGVPGNYGHGTAAMLTGGRGRPVAAATRRRPWK